MPTPAPNGRADPGALPISLPTTLRPPSAPLSNSAAASVPGVAVVPDATPRHLATDLLQKLTAAQNQLRLHMLPRTGLYSFPDRLLHILLIPPLSLPHCPASTAQFQDCGAVHPFRRLVQTRVGSIRTPAIIAQSLYPFLHLPPIRAPTRAQAIGVSFPLIQTHPRCPHRVQMHISAQFQSPSRPLHHNGFEPPLEQGPHSPVPAVKAHAVTAL